ncbi:MAG: endonuclease domain-containing protein, partial [Stellaceae bacterium]
CPSPAMRERVPSAARRVRVDPACPINMPRRLRREPTDAEQRLWALLRDRRLAGYKFRRQHPIDNFIVDFACTRHRLVIEADGGQHAENVSDERRTPLLQLRGWRFWNNEILMCN